MQLGLLHPTGANDVLSDAIFVREFFLSFFLSFSPFFLPFFLSALLSFNAGVADVPSVESSSERASLIRHQ